jgi:Rieske Fe-S protein
MSDQEPEASDIVKPKKPRSAAQVDAFKKAQEKRHERLRAMNKPAPETLAPVVKPTVETPKPSKKPVKPAKVVYEDAEESDDEPQQIIIRRKKKVKPQIVYEESESDEEEPVDRKQYAMQRKSERKAPPVKAPTVRPLQSVQQSYGLQFI